MDYLAHHLEPKRIFGTALVQTHYYHYIHLTASSRTTWVIRYQKDKTSLNLSEARDDGVLGWQWHQVVHMQTICFSLQTDNHTNTASPETVYE